MRQIRVRLTEPHTHAGTPCAPGTELTLPEHDALWLTAHRKAVFVRGRRTEPTDTTGGETRLTGETHG